MATHSSILPWTIPWTEKPDRLQSMGVAKSQTWLTDETATTATTLLCSGYQAHSLYHFDHHNSFVFAWPTFTFLLVAFILLSVVWLTNNNSICLKCHTFSSFFSLPKVAILTRFLITYKLGTSLVVQWLRHLTSTAGSAGSISGLETKILYAVMWSQKKKKKGDSSINLCFRKDISYFVWNKWLGKMWRTHPSFHKKKLFSFATIWPTAAYLWILRKSRKSLPWTVIHLS